MRWDHNPNPANSTPKILPTFPLTNLVLICFTTARNTVPAEGPQPPMRFPQRRTQRLLLVATPVVLLIAAVAFVFWSAQRTLSRSADVASTQHQIRFSLRPLDPTAAQSANLPFEPVAAPDNFTSGTVLDGTLYLAGPNGLTIVAPDGTRRLTLRTGFELPVAPIAAVTTGRLRGATETQILLATAGAGLLLLDSKATLHQLLPATPEARDLTALLPMPSGDLLLGTHHSGVLLFDGSTLAPYGHLPASEITALAAADATSILVGTHNSGLIYLHAGTVQQASGLPDNQIDSILVANGKAYAGTPLGIAQFDLTQPDLKAQRILAAGTFAHALASVGPVLQVGTLDRGIQQISLAGPARILPIAAEISANQTGTMRIYSFVYTHGLSTPLYALTDGNLLAQTTSGWHPALTPPTTTLADRNISALAFSADGSLYVGFFDHGLDILPANGRTHHLEDDNLFCINRLVLDPTRQTIAAATANGLVLFDRQGTPRQTLTRRDGLISDHVTDIAFTPTGTTVATPAGLTFITPAAAESLYAFQGLVNNHVYTLAATNDHVLAGTLGGISLLESNAVKRNLTATNSGLKHNWVTALAPSPQGGWLVGTYGAGLMSLSADANTFTPIDLPAGTPRDLVINPNALLVTRTHIYAGTLNHGVLIFNSATNRWSVIETGLPSLNVTAFAVNDGVVYIGTENGLVRIPEAKLP